MIGIEIEAEVGIEGMRETGDMKKRKRKVVMILTTILKSPVMRNLRR